MLVVTFIMLDPTATFYMYSTDSAML